MTPLETWLEALKEYHKAHPLNETNGDRQAIAVIEKLKESLEGMTHYSCCNDCIKCLPCDAKELLNSIDPEKL